MFAVGAYFADYSTMAAATLSALSHAYPSQRLHDLDLLGVGLVFANVAMNYNVILERPDILYWGAGAIALNITDTIVTRKHLDKVGPWIHVAWHLSAGLALYKFNAAKVDVDLANTAIASKAYLPGFINTLSNTVSACSESLSKSLRDTFKPYA